MEADYISNIFWKKAHGKNQNAEINNKQKYAKNQ